MQTKSQPLNARAHSGQLGAGNRGVGERMDLDLEKRGCPGKALAFWAELPREAPKGAGPRPEGISRNRGLLKRHPVLKMGKKCLYLTGTRKTSAPSSFTETRPILPSSLRRYPTHPVVDEGNSPGGRLLVILAQPMNCCGVFQLTPSSRTPHLLTD